MLNWNVINRTYYLYENGLALNNLQRLICHKNEPTNQPIKIFNKHPQEYQHRFSDFHFRQSKVIRWYMTVGGFLYALSLCMCLCMFCIYPIPASIYIYIYIYIYTNPSARSIFKRSLTGLNSDFFFLLD